MSYQSMRSAAKSNRAAVLGKYAAGGAVSDAKQDRAAVASGVHRHERRLHKGETETKFAAGGSVLGLARGGRSDRPGKKAHTQVNIIMPPGGGGAAAPPQRVPVPVPVPTGGPPGAPPPGGPPMAGPGGMPPPGLRPPMPGMGPGGPPGGMPMPMRARGGMVADENATDVADRFRANAGKGYANRASGGGVNNLGTAASDDDSFPTPGDVYSRTDDGALRKTAIQPDYRKAREKEVSDTGRARGGRMTAGAMSGVGRIEKAEGKH